jgi:hypothetical protein
MVEEHLSYREGRPWEYWFDKEGTQLLPQDNFETISHLEEYYTTNSEHLSHCSFMLLRFYKVLGRGGDRLDSLTTKYDHAHHCLMYLLKMAEGNKYWNYVGTHGTIGFEEC